MTFNEDFRPCQGHLLSWILGPVLKLEWCAHNISIINVSNFKIGEEKSFSIVPLEDDFLKFKIFLSDLSIVISSIMNLMFGAVFFCF